MSTVSVATDRFYFISPFGDSFRKDLHVVINTRSEITLAPSDMLAAGFGIQPRTIPGYICFRR